MKLQITFDIIPKILSLRNKIEEIKTINNLHTKSIIENIKENAQINSNSEIISYEFGIINLISCSIKINNDSFLITLIVEANCVPTMTNENENFRFSIDGKYYLKHYSMTFIDTPKNIQINQII